MKKTQRYFAAVLSLCLALSLGACVTAPRQTVLDAALPEAEQSVLVVLGTGDGWYDVTLDYVDDTIYNATGSIFYIPSGNRTLGISLSSSSSERDYSEPNVVTTTTWTGTADLKVTAELLPGHTYRMVVRTSSDFEITDITDNVAFPVPKRAPYAPDDGVITNWAEPRGFFFTPGTMNVAPYLQYTRVPGEEAKAVYLGSSVDNKYTTLISEWGSTGIKAFSMGMGLQGGLETGYRKFGASLLAEINGGIGFFGTTYEAGWFNWGYLFLAELYHSDYVGVGFGYGKKTALYPFFTTDSTPGRQAAHINQFPHLRLELIISPGKSAITLYGDYYLEKRGWGVGIAGSILPKGEGPFPKIFLR